MVESSHKQSTGLNLPDPRWKDLYRIGGIASLLLGGLAQIIPIQEEEN